MGLPLPALECSKMGPKRDIVGEWQKAAHKHKLPFGVSEHLGASFAWFTPSHGFDQFWPKIGVDYDGANPAFNDLYHTRAQIRLTKTKALGIPPIHNLSSTGLIALMI